MDVAKYFTVEVSGHNYRPCRLRVHNQGLASHLLANLHGRSLKIDTCHLSTLPTNPTGANSCTELRGVEPANLAYSIPQPQHALEGQT
jgi:hypothetical protein